LGPKEASILTVQAGDDDFRTAMHWTRSCKPLKLHSRRHDMTISCDVAELYGWHAGDGTLYRTSSGIVWELRGGVLEQEFYDHCVVPLLLRLGIHVETRFRSGGKNGCIGVRCCAKTFIELILAGQYPLGKKAHVVRSPRQVLNGDSDVKRAFLRGLFATDGTVFFTRINNGSERMYPRIEFCSSSRQLRDEVLELLREKGFVASQWTYTPKSRGGPTYFLRIAGEENLNRFAREVGFGNPKHTTVVNSRRNV
jgi:hypothetical protein